MSSECVWHVFLTNQGQRRTDFEFFRAGDAVNRLRNKRIYAATNDLDEYTSDRVWVKRAAVPQPVGSAKGPARERSAAAIAFVPCAWPDASGWHLILDRGLGAISDLCCGSRL